MLFNYIDRCNIGPFFKKSRLLHLEIPQLCSYIHDMDSKLIKLSCPSCGKTNKLPANRLAQVPKCGICHNKLFLGKSIELNGTNFSKVISNTDIPIVVDYWAEWCGPCKMMAPIFEQVANQLEPHVRFAKLNTEAAPAVASQFAIRSIPTLIIFKNGSEVARQSGALDAGRLKHFIKMHI